MVKREYFDLNVSVFVNKKNNQISIALPRKKLKFKTIPRELPIRIYKDSFIKQVKGGRFK